MKPPAWRRVLARFLVRGPNSEFVLGDLEEMYEAVRRERGAGRADAAYLVWVVRSGVGAARDSVVGGVGGDVRVALRQFRRRPRVFFGGAAVLAVGLGVSVLTWGVRYGASGRPLPVSDPDQVVSLRLTDTRASARTDVSLDDVVRLTRSVPGLQVAGVWAGTTANLTDETGPAEKVDVTEASSGLFQVMEFVPLHGRLLLPSDDVPGSPRVAVLGHLFWATRYGADPGMVGRSIRLDGEAYEVVGVLPEGVGLTAHEDVWRSAVQRGATSDRGYNTLARKSPGVTLETLNTQLDETAARFAAAGIDEWMGHGAVALEFHEAFYGGVSSLRDRLLASAGVLLFVMALANVGNLFLVYTRSRTGELSLRRALGAGRIAIVRQLCIEAAVPAALGAVGAIFLAWWALAWYQAASDAYGVGFVWQVYRLEVPHVLLIVAGALLSTLFVSLTASVRELRGEGVGGLRAGRGVVGSRFRVGQAFLAVQVAVGAALLLVAVLMARSAVNLRSVDYGFTTAGVMTADITLAGPRYEAPGDRMAFWDQLAHGVAKLPGVRSSTVGTQLPMIRCCGNVGWIEVEGREFQEVRDLARHYVNAVDPGYFDTFERPVLAGRGIAATDASDGMPVALVNVHFAERYFPGVSPLGKRVRVWRGAEPGPWRTVVGVAPHLWMDTDVNQNPEGLYVPLAQMAPRRASVALLVATAPADYAEDLRSVVGLIDRDLPLNEVRTMPQLIRDRTSLYRLQGPLFILVGMAALVLTLVGLYAVVSYTASLRSAEFGVRAALGAGRTELLARAMGRATLPTAAGALAGLPVGLALIKGMDRFLFMVDPWSPGMAVLSVITLGLATGAASLLPALRASRVDLVTVLKAE